MSIFELSNVDRPTAFPCPSTGPISWHSAGGSLFISRTVWPAGLSAIGVHAANEMMRLHSSLSMAAGDDTQAATSRDEIAMLQSPVMDELVRTYWSGQRDDVRAELAAALAGVCARVREQDPRVEDREVVEALAAKCPSDDVLAY